MFVILEVGGFSWRGLVLWRCERRVMMRGNGGLDSLF